MAGGNTENVASIEAVDDMQTRRKQEVVDMRSATPHKSLEKKVQSSWKTYRESSMSNRTN